MAALQEEVATRDRQLGASHLPRLLASATSRPARSCSSIPSRFSASALLPLCLCPTHPLCHYRPQHTLEGQLQFLAPFDLCRSCLKHSRDLSRRHPCDVPQCPVGNSTENKVSWFRQHLDKSNWSCWCDRWKCVEPEKVQLNGIWRTEASTARSADGCTATR
jgi:hypothetical protein